MQMQDSRHRRALLGTGGAQDLKNRNEWKVRGHLLAGLGFRVRRQEIIEYEFRVRCQEIIEYEFRVRCQEIIES